MANYYIIGSGITGATLARILAEAGHSVTVLEKEEGPGGHVRDQDMLRISSHNGYDIEEETTLMSLYGPHIFHTSNPRVWDFANRFATFNHYEHIVYTFTEAGWLPWPINKTTIEKVMEHRYADEYNVLFKGDRLAQWRHEVDMTKAAMWALNSPMTSFHEKAINLVGHSVYGYTMMHYTTRQWQRHPKDVPGEVLTRVRVKYDDSLHFFNDAHVALPQDGYTNWINNMLDHPRISCYYNMVMHEYDFDMFQGTIISTAPSDAIARHRFGKLEYLKVRFETFVDEAAENACKKWPSAVVNFSVADANYTRGTAYHKLWGSKYPIVVLERPGEGSELYPVRTKRNIELHEKYEAYLQEKKVICAGRLGAFKYIDMDRAIELAMSLADELLK